MSNFKSVIGYDDNLSSRLQEIAPTQYAVGKLRAGRTPYDRDGTTVIKDANRLLRPDLYIMELDSDTRNITDDKGTLLKSGVMYLYHIVADPDESLHGGHAITSTSVTMHVRQIGYYQNGTTTKVLTRTGVPLSSYSGTTVDRLDQVTTGSSSLVFVKELGMWVKRQSAIELAVTWTAWKEFGGGTITSQIVPTTYNFLTDVTNGVGLATAGTDTYKAVGYVATTSTYGVVRVLNVISAAQFNLDTYVPTANAVYNALAAVSQIIEPVRLTAMTAGANAAAAVATATAADAAVQYHIENHPTIPNASYAVTGDSVTNKKAGAVYTTPKLTSINDTYASAKYTVPTANLLCATSKELNDAIAAVDNALQNHIDHHPVAATYGGSDPIYVDVGVTSNTIGLHYLVGISNGIIMDTVDTGNGYRALAAAGIPAGHNTYGVVKTYHNVENLMDDSIVPTLNTLYMVSTGLSNFIANTSLGLSAYTARTSSDLSNYVNNVSGALYAHTQTPHGGTVGSATFNTAGIVKTTDTVAVSPYQFVVPTITALTNVSKHSSEYVDAVSSILAEHVANGAIHGGGGDNVTTSGVIKYNVKTGGGKEIYLNYDKTNTYNGVKLNSDSVSGLYASGVFATTGSGGVVVLTQTVASNVYDYYVPTATAVWQALQNQGGGGGVGSGSIDAPSYNVPSGWGWSAEGTAVYTGNGGSNGGWLLISIVMGSGANGCVGVSINGNYIPLFGGANCGSTKVLPIPPGANIIIYNGAGTGTQIKACGFGTVYVSEN